MDAPEDAPDGRRRDGRAPQHRADLAGVTDGADDAGERRPGGSASGSGTRSTTCSTDAPNASDTSYVPNTSGAPDTSGAPNTTHVPNTSHVPDASNTSGDGRPARGAGAGHAQAEGDPDAESPAGAGRLAPDGSLVVVGAGLAGLSAARAARQLGFTGPLTIVGAEAHLPYDRPPLSKDYLSGAAGADALRLMPDDDPLLADARWLRGRSATGIVVDPTGRAHEVLLDDGTRLAAGGVVLATGSTARPPEAAGVPQAPNVHTLRTREDADALRAALVPGARVLVVGGGLVGSEITSTAADLGGHVTVVDPAEAPLSHLVGPLLAPALLARHARAGVRLLTGRSVAGVEPARTPSAPTAALTAVHLDDGEIMGVDVVVVAVGDAPATGWLAGSGLVLADGLVCDEVGRASAPGIVAVGDCAAWLSPALGRHDRGRHWHDALDRPADAVAALLGVDAPRRRAYVPYVWSDQYGSTIQVVGRPALADTLEVADGSLDDPGAGLLVDLLRDGVPVAAVALDRPRDLARRRKALAAQA